MNVNDAIDYIEMVPSVTLSNVIDSIPALIAAVDCNMQLQYSNVPFKKRFFLQATDATDSFPLVVGEEVFQQLQRQMGKVLFGVSAQFKIALNAIDGFRCLDVRLIPQFNNKKKVDSFIFYGVDVTESYKAECALRDYFENATIGLHWVNEDGIIIWANPAELKMLGYDSDEYIGHSITEFHASKDSIEDILRRLQRGEILHNYDADLLCKDGSIKHVSINSSVLREGEKFIHTRCFTVDITEQKKAQRAVDESQERFKMIADLVPLIIWTTNEKGKCNYVNQRWEGLTGKSEDSALGEEWINFIHPDDRDNIYQSWLTSFTARKDFDAKFRLLNKEGKYTINFLNSVPWHNPVGEFVGYIGIIQDITEQEQIKYSLEKMVLTRTEDLRKKNASLKQAEYALQKKNVMLEKMNNELSSFAYVASHDLQEPLRKIKTFGERFMQQERGISELGKDYLIRIMRASGRMSRLIDDLLSFSRINYKEEKFEPVDLNVLLSDVVDDMEIIIREKKAVIEYSALPEVNAVRFQFHQLFSNLLSNALKFSSRDRVPHIVVKHETVAGAIPGEIPGVNSKFYHHITFSDNGIGFDPDYNEKIFEMFHRLHGRTEFEGTGLGLSICKKIIENHNGTIRAEGVPDVGVTFHIYLSAPGIG